MVAKSAWGSLENAVANIVMVLSREHANQTRIAGRCRTVISCCPFILIASSKFGNSLRQGSEHCPHRGSE